MTLCVWQTTKKTVLAQGTDGPGRPMSFLTCEDETGIAEMILFPDAFRQHRRVLAQDGPVVVAGTVQRTWRTTTVVVSRVFPARLEISVPSPAGAAGPYTQRSNVGSGPERIPSTRIERTASVALKALKG